MVRFASRLLTKPHFDHAESPSGLWIKSGSVLAPVLIQSKPM
jgi:hypothetical protein